MVILLLIIDLLIYIDLDIELHYCFIDVCWSCW